MTLTPLFEITFSEAPQVDRDAGVIRGVRVLGRTSRNGREYSDAALQQAARLYEGIGVNLNHPSRPQGEGARLVEDGFGWLQGITLRNDGVYGDLHYFRAHPSADVIVEAAARNPRRFGLSHHAEGAVVKQGGKLVVESIESVRSVDLVQNPATTNGLFESETPVVGRMVVEVLQAAGGPLAELTAADEFRERVTLTEALESEGDGDEAIAAAVYTVVTDLLEDDQLDVATRLRQTDRWLRAWRALPDESSGSESVLIGLKERIARVELENRCRGLLETGRRSCDPTRIEELIGLSTDEERQRRVECWPVEGDNRSAVARPVTSRPLFEAGQERTFSKFPEDARAFVAALR